MCNYCPCLRHFLDTLGYEPMLRILIASSSCGRPEDTQRVSRLTPWPPGICGTAWKGWCRMTATWRERWAGWRCLGTFWRSSGYIRLISDLRQKMLRKREIGALLKTRHHFSASAMLSSPCKASLRCPSEASCRPTMISRPSKRPCWSKAMPCRRSANMLPWPGTLCWDLRRRSLESARCQCVERELEVNQ